MSSYGWYPVLILEKGFLPQGASTKNAGFACFGSPTEILDDLKNLNEKEVVSLIKSRWDGLKLLRKNIGDKNIGYKCHGGYELFFDPHHQGQLIHIDYLPDR